MTHRDGVPRLSARSAWRGNAGHRKPCAPSQSHGPSESIGKPPFRSGRRTAGGRRQVSTTRPPQQRRCRCGGWMSRIAAATKAPGPRRRVGYGNDPLCAACGNRDRVLASRRRPRFRPVAGGGAPPPPPRSPRQRQTSPLARRGNSTFGGWMRTRGEQVACIS